MGHAYLLCLCDPVFIGIRAISESLDRSSESEPLRRDKVGFGHGSNLLGFSRSRQMCGPRGPIQIQGLWKVATTYGRIHQS